MNLERKETLIEVCTKLLEMKVGDRPRIMGIKKRAEEGKILYQLDKKYLERLTVYIRYEEEPKKIEPSTTQPQKKLAESYKVTPEKKTSFFKIRKKSNEDIPKTVENQTPSENTTGTAGFEPERERTFKEILEDQDGPRDPNKMRWGVAIGGAVLLAFGLVLVVTGSAVGLEGMCFFAGGRCYTDIFQVFGGWAMFWIGIIPTIFGIRYVAKA